MLALQCRVLSVILLGACAGSVQGPNSVYRSNLEVLLTEREAQVAALEGRLWTLRQEIADAEREAAEAQDESWRTEAVLRERTDELDRQIRTLRAAEEDLRAARQRQAEIAVELAEVRTLEEQLAHKQQRLAELRTAIAALETQIVEREAAFARRQAQAAARFAELERLGAMLGSLEGLVQKAVQEILVIAGPYFNVPGQGKDGG